MGGTFLLWSTNFEGNSSHIRIFIQVNWLVTLLLISLRKASIRGGGERNLPLSQEYSLSSHEFMGGQKTQKHYHKTQFKVSSMCSQPIHQTCQQTTSMGVAESKQPATWVFQNSVTNNLPFFTRERVGFIRVTSWGERNLTLLVLVAWATKTLLSWVCCRISNYLLLLRALSRF